MRSSFALLVYFFYVLQTFPIWTIPFLTTSRWVCFFVIYLVKPFQKWLHNYRFDISYCEHLLSHWVADDCVECDDHFLCKLPYIRMRMSKTRHYKFLEDSLLIPKVLINSILFENKVKYFQAWRYDMPSKVFNFSRTDCDVHDSFDSVLYFDRGVTEKHKESLDSCISSSECLSARIIYEHFNKRPNSLLNSFLINIPTANSWA